MSTPFIDVLTHQVQYVALTFMAVVYLIRIFWLFKFVAPKESTAPRGSHTAGITNAMVNIALPWQLESYRKKPLRYVEFVIFHIGVAVVIAASIIKPETDLTLGAHNNWWATAAWVGPLCQIICAAALATGVFRLVRRMVRPEMRAISSPDDYFSIIILCLWLAAGVFGLKAAAPEWATVSFFVMTTFFLVYVPFSKISHYLYYPFNKWYVGKHLGHRGVYPKGVRIVTTCGTEIPNEEAILVGKESKATV